MTASGECEIVGEVDVERDANDLVRANGESGLRCALGTVVIHRDDVVAGVGKVDVQGDRGCHCGRTLRWRGTGSGRLFVPEEKAEHRRFVKREWRKTYDGGAGNLWTWTNRPAYMQLGRPSEVEFEMIWVKNRAKSMYMNSSSSRSEVIDRLETRIHVEPEA